MEGKGIIRMFLILMALVCIWQFFLVVPTMKVERDADAYAEQRVAANPDLDEYEQRKRGRADYLDSMSNETVMSLPLIKDYTYTDLKNQQINLGLDLKGGMSTILQVDLDKFLYDLSGQNNDPTFTAARAAASKTLASAQTDYISLFADEFAKISDGKSLATIFNKNLRDEVRDMDNGDVILVLREKANQTVNLTFERLKDRIDKFGVTQPNVTLDAARDLISVELPGVDNPERARKLLKSSAKLEFWHTNRVDQSYFTAFAQADELLKNELGDTSSSGPQIVFDTIQIEQVDSLGNQILDASGAVVTKDSLIQRLSDPVRGPLLSLLDLNGSTGGMWSGGANVIGTADKKNMNKINSYLAKKEVKALFKSKNADFRWSADPTQNAEGLKTNKYELHVIRTERKPGALLEGDAIIKADVSSDPNTGEINVGLTKNQKGAKVWAKMTKEAAADNQRQIAIVLDSTVVSAPSVNVPILTGSSSITGNFDLQEAQDLANILEIGKLPADIDILQESLVGPSLGAKNIRSSALALIVGFLLVLVFMIFYYGSAGIVAALALLLNLFFIFGALASFGTVLTLPGFAGVLLTIGMAVDANVIIFERIREELREGKTNLMAINDGFKNSYSAIIDANVTTIIVAIILAYFGLGPIKGFAVVLIIGVISSMFTAVLVGRLIIEWWIGRGNELTFWTGFSKNLFANLNIDWIGKRKLAYGISLTLIALGAVSFFMRGFELGVDFRGGYSYNIQLDNSLNLSADDLREGLADVFEGEVPIVKAVDTENTYAVTTSYLIDETEGEPQDRVMEQLFKGVNVLAGGNLNFEEFKSPEGDGTQVISSAKVGPTIADDIKRSSFKATIFALLAIFLYIFLRFSRWQYSLGAVAALFHDTLLILALFSIGHGWIGFSMEIDQAFIAAILTVIGYSINDTVVVFDRIREFFGIYSKKTKKDVINLAVNSTVSRTVITSLTTLLMVLVLFLFGSGSIRGFAFALLVGVIVGTYSSIFVATPIFHDTTGEIESTNKKKETGKSFTRAKA